MCGIAGIFNYGSGAPPSKELLARMSDRIRHRGPDDDGEYIDSNRGVGFVHRRLSIIDIGGGHQPMSTHDGLFWIVFNGEIYNFRELRAELVKSGVAFRTNSDTEVILELFRRHREQAFAMLNGIFALAIHDFREGSVTLARDHFGVKPLYYTYDAGKLTFGSEIKALCADDSLRRELDLEAFNSFLTFRYNPSPQTLLRGVRKLQPGHYLRTTRKGVGDPILFFRESRVTNASVSEREAIEEYRRLLRAAVHRQMVSDVPVGLLLSGGVDSAAIGYLMREVTRGEMHSFTAGFPGEGDFNELADARQSASILDSVHHDVEVTRNAYVDFFVDSASVVEEPIAEPTIPALYFVSKLAASHVKVVLAGQGADEPLAGYHRYLGEKYLNLLSPILHRLPLESLASILPRNERLKRAAFASRYVAERERFLAISTIFTPHLKTRLIRPEVAAAITRSDGELLGRIHDRAQGIADALSRLLFVDTRMSLSDNLLLFGDKVSMAHALEVRVPFLDLNLVAFIESLPGNLKLRGTTRKYIHKNAVAGWLPNEIIHRKKRGFATPIDEWLQSHLVEFARRTLLSKNSASRRYFVPAVVQEMLTLHSAGRENYRRHLFALLSFEFWHRTFLDNISIDKEALLHEN
jgi:asparagine synthase (glutamine-hydrolysing)